MFCYTQGYELDGSDSSYNIINEDLNKLIEVLKYFLNLKIINRGKKIKLCLQYEKDKKNKKIIYLDWEELYKLDEIFSAPDILKCTIYYNFVNFEKLYPEVKREIIDISLQKEREYKNIKLVNPVLFSRYGYEISDLLIIYFSNKESRNIYDCIELDSQRESTVKRLLENPMFLLEINASIGTSYEYHHYIVSHVAERFPELNIDVNDVCSYIYKDFYTAKESVYERIYINSIDYIQTLKRFAETDIFTFMGIRNKGKYLKEDYSTDKEYITLINMSNDIAKYNPKQEFGKNTLYDILYYKSEAKTEMTIQEYINFIYKIKDVKFFDKYDFSYYSKFMFYMKYEENLYKSVIGFEKLNDNIIMFMDIPFKLKDYTKRKLFI